MTTDFRGHHGRLGVSPFCEVILGKSECGALSSVLKAQVSSPNAGRVTIAVTKENPDRIRLKFDALPAYEANARPHYLKGDVCTIQGTPNNSCNLYLSSRFGSPIFTAELDAAVNAARGDVLLRVPSKARNIVLFIPDTDPRFPQPSGIHPLDLSQIRGLEVEDFSDWEQ